MALEQWPAFYYHKEVAEKGRIFQNEEELKKAEKENPGWVDTPAKFK